MECENPQESELRFQLDHGSTAHVSLKSGTAEIFGAEVPSQTQVTVRSQNVAIFTYHGCDIEVGGPIIKPYTNSDTPMLSYVNANHILHRKREQAQSQANTKGPRVALAAPSDHGKSTLCRILLNYAVKQGWRPLFVDVDVGQGDIATPGSVAASPIGEQIDCDGGFPVDMPIVFPYGYTSPTDMPELYRRSLRNLAALAQSWCKSDAGSSAAGVVINTMGYVEDSGFTMLCDALRCFEVDVVLVVGDDALKNELETEFSDGSIEIAQLPKSGGVRKRSKAARKQTRNERISSYFYGSKNELTPHSRDVSFNDVSLVKIGGRPKAPTDALPLGQEAVSDPLRVTEMKPSMQHYNSLVAFPNTNNPDEAIDSNLAGFACVTDVDETKETVTLLCPSSGELPSSLLLEGGIKWFDE